MTDRPNSVVRATVKDAVKNLGIFFPEDDAPGGPTIAALRRGRGSLVDTTGSATLVDRDGVLLWHDSEGAVVTPTTASAMRRGRAVVPAEDVGDIVVQVRFEKLAPNQVGGFLETLDLQLNPALTPSALLPTSASVLRRWDHARGQFVPADAPDATSKRTLLMVHGTFSSGEYMKEGLRKSGYLAFAAGQYDEILSFEHATLSVSPVMNALDLARLFAALPAGIDLDVVAHSRGGLIVRWWFEVLGGAGRNRRAVLVGAPLGGTSLAAPARLRAALDFFTNVGNLLSAAGGALSAGMPFLTVATGLLKVATSVLGTAAHTPLADAVVAMIPGLHGQSRISNSPELSRLMAAGGLKPRYGAIKAAFRPAPMTWKFWNYFVHLGDHALSAAANLVFDADNDLVVDTGAMGQLFRSGDTFTDIAPRNVLDFGTQATVHHTNYFEQPETAAHLRSFFS